MFLEVLDNAPSSANSDILSLYQADLNNLITNLTYEASGDFAEGYPSDNIDEIINSLQGISNNLSMTDEQKQELLEDVSIYRTGYYDDLLTNTYNTNVICNQIGGTISGNSCNY